MAIVELKTDKQFEKAIGVLVEMGGLFQTRYPRKLLMLGPNQLQALRQAGLLPKVNGARKRGKKKS